MASHLDLDDGEGEPEATMHSTGRRGCMKDSQRPSEMQLTPRLQVEPGHASKRSAAAGWSIADHDNGKLGHRSLTNGASSRVRADV